MVEGREGNGGRWIVLMLGLATLLFGAEAEAFCGFYVGGADAKLFNNATMVALMRDGKRTVLSMQNNYQGPPSDFAMVVPVPVVLQKENVKTLPAKIFDRLDRLAAPRLVEYWEQDPCLPPMPRRRMLPMAPRGGAAAPKPSPPPAAYSVKIEAQFKVGEYEVVILSAGDSAGLEAWLEDQGYNIPAGAEPFLRPYVQQGMKFFVAKVDIQKVKMANGQAELSPLRFHYDTDHFALPVRLGLMNAQDAQDLIVHILAKQQRYEVANFDNVTIPTNVEVTNPVKKRFGEFYAALFDATVKKNPKAVVTEYAWQATSCDPCPGPPLGSSDFMSLGGDVLPSIQAQVQPKGDGPPSRRRGWRGPRPGNDFVLTRLHARYKASSLGEDLVFRKAKPIVGGREVRNGPGGKLEQTASFSSLNNFQGRYIIRHPWTGAVNCPNPRRGIWGGPPGGGSRPKPSAAQDTAFAPRGKVPLSTFVKKDPTGRTLTTKGSPMGLAASIGAGQQSAKTTPAPVPAASTTTPTPAPSVTPMPAPTTTPSAPPPDGGCGSCAIDDRPSFPSTGLLALLGWLWLRRRSKGR